MNTGNISQQMALSARHSTLSFLTYIWIICISMSSPLPKDQTHPNIIFFIIDDMPFMKDFNESAPIGVHLNNYTVTYDDYPTPNINRFRNETVIFPKSFVGGSKCAPSRYSILTGRQPSRSKFAIRSTLKSGNGSEGTTVTVQSVKLSGYDTIYNLPQVLQDNGYYTGTVGKWHLLDYFDNGFNYGCDKLASKGNATLYAMCTSVVQKQGFDFVDGWFFSNIVTDGEFSHNPEWLVSQSQRFIDIAVNTERKPFFLYFASTLSHSAGDIFETLTNYTYRSTPKGILSGDEIPDDTTMRTREEIWDLAKRYAGFDSTFREKKNYARYLWADEQFGALIDYLETKGVYDETLVIVQSDHGMEAKGTLYEHGSRIFNYLRYPPLFGSDQIILPDDLLVSNVDLAATIFDLIGTTVPDNYTMDGVSWLNHVVTTIHSDGDTANDEDDDDSCCKYKFVDIQNSRSIVTADYQYIWRANGLVETSGGVDTLYKYCNDREQLYDLVTDPDEQHNVIDDSSLRSLVTSFRSIMRDYVNATCPVEHGHGNRCLMPSRKVRGDLNVEGVVGWSEVMEYEKGGELLLVLGMVMAAVSLWFMMRGFLWMNAYRVKVKGRAMKGGVEVIDSDEETESEDDSLEWWYKHEL